MFDSFSTFVHTPSVKCDSVEPSTPHRSKSGSTGCTRSLRGCPPVRCKTLRSAVADSPFPALFRPPARSRGCWRCRQHEKVTESCRWSKDGLPWCAEPTASTKTMARSRALVVSSAVGVINHGSGLVITSRRMTSTCIGAIVTRVARWGRFHANWTRGVTVWVTARYVLKSILVWEDLAGLDPHKSTLDPTTRRVSAFPSWRLLGLRQAPYVACAAAPAVQKGAISTYHAAVMMYPEPSRAGGCAAVLLLCCMCSIVRRELVPCTRTCTCICNITIRRYLSFLVNYSKDTFECQREVPDATSEHQREGPAAAMAI